jgi:hypothetical protein
MLVDSQDSLTIYENPIEVDSQDVISQSFIAWISRETRGKLKFKGNVKIFPRWEKESP